MLRNIRTNSNQPLNPVYRKVESRFKMIPGIFNLLIGVGTTPTLLLFMTQGTTERLQQTPTDPRQPLS